MVHKLYQLINFLSCPGEGAAGQGAAMFSQPVCWRHDGPHWKTGGPRDQHAGRLEALLCPRGLRERDLSTRGQSQTLINMEN